MLCEQLLSNNERSGSKQEQRRKENERLDGTVPSSSFEPLFSICRFTGARGHPGLRHLWMTLLVQPPERARLDLARAPAWARRTCGRAAGAALRHLARCRLSGEVHARFLPLGFPKALPYFPLGNKLQKAAESYQALGVWRRGECSTACV